MDVKKKVQRKQDAHIFVRLTQEQKDAYTQAATRQERSVAHWLRILANRELKKLGIKIQQDNG
jgi:uncharacterized protein (DUF1778 family)